MMDLKWTAAETVSTVTTDPIGSCEDRLDNVLGNGDPLDFLLDKDDFGLGIVCREGSFREIAKSAHGMSVLVDTRDDVCIESETEECVVRSFIHASAKWICSRRCLSGNSRTFNIQRFGEVHIRCRNEGSPEAAGPPCIPR